MAKDEKVAELQAAVEAKDAELEGRINEAVREAVAASERKVRQLTAQADPRAAKVSYCLEAIGRAMADINGIVAAMNSENVGSGDQIRMKCEAGLLRLCNTYGWQV